MSTLCEVGQAETNATMYHLHVGLKHDKDELIYETLCLFTLHAEYIVRNARLDGPQAGIKISGRSINNLR